MRMPITVLPLMPEDSGCSWPEGVDGGVETTGGWVGMVGVSEGVVGAGAFGVGAGMVVGVGIGLFAGGV